MLLFLSILTRAVKVTPCSRALRLRTHSVPFRDFLYFFVFLYFLTILHFVTWSFLRFFVSIVSRVLEESHQSSTCFRFFLHLARFEYSLLASEENEEEREVSLLLLLSETCSESPYLSDPSAIFLHEPVTDQSPHDFGQREPIERDKLRMFLRSASQARNPFIQQHTTCNTRSFKKFSYNTNKNGIPNSWLFLQGSTPHQGN